MRTIHKFDLTVGTVNAVEIPSHAIIRHLGVQDGIIRLWVEVDTNKFSRENRVFCVYGTGHEIGGCREHYVGTVQIGPFVWHVYERR